jgi:hypothetical protein
MAEVDHVHRDCLSLVQSLELNFLLSTYFDFRLNCDSISDLADVRFDYFVNEVRERKSIIIHTTFSLLIFF